MKNISNKILLVIIGITACLALVIFYLTYNWPSKNGGMQTAINYEQESKFGIPLHLSIPSINVEADIEPAGLAKDGTIAVPKGPDGVTWYKDGARPGEKGSAVVTGHYGPWLSGANSVFDNLTKLAQGDKIYIKDNKGNNLTFQVRETKTYKLNETVPEVFIKDDASYLNLITCSGEWITSQKTFTNRFVVFTELIEQ